MRHITVDRRHIGETTQQIEDNEAHLVYTGYIGETTQLIEDNETQPCG